MSEKNRRITGILLVLASLAVSMIPMMFLKGSDEDLFRSGIKAEWGITRIETERNGSIAVNEADEEELRMLPGIGEKLSGMIVQERKENGPYYYAEDLEAVKGIGPGILGGFRDMIDLAMGESGE
ncbi:MAG: helix-hairpin-helix domain-containing protein [Clostridia bacterium]|nr:helix-hairpin-helix domain-containing protein [Clostridia bacterium]